MQLLFEIITIKNYEKRGDATSPMYYGSKAIGEYNGKPVFSNFSSVKCEPFDTDTLAQLKVVYARMNMFTSSTYNRSVRIAEVDPVSKVVTRVITTEDFKKEFPLEEKPVEEKTINENGETLVESTEYLKNEFVFF